MCSGMEHGGLSWGESEVSSKLLVSRTSPNRGRTTARACSCSVVVVALIASAANTIWKRIRE